MKNAPSAWLFAALLLSACSDEPSNRYQGYVEGDYLRIAAPVGGQLAELSVERGQAVAVGAPLFALEREREEAAAAEAAQRLTQARASLVLAQAQQRRAADLRRRRLASQEQLDLADTELTRAEGRLHELGAQQAQADWQLRQRRQAAPAAGVIEEVYFRPGEWVPAGTPVVSLLPPQNRRLLFFVPQTTVGALRAGARVRVSCDGCAAPIDAAISAIATQPEFTPPVIYSREQRTRLVFRIEARAPAADAVKLAPGQPVDVELLP